MADPRLFIRLHDGMPEHPKIVGLSDKAFRALIELWCYCSRNLTDGNVPKAITRRATTPKTRRELLDAGLLIDRSDSFEMHDYLEHQRSAGEVSDLRERRREAGKKGGKAKAKALANASAGANQTASKNVAETETETDSKDSSSETADAAPRPEAQHLCEILQQLITDNGSKKPTITKRWQDDARRMIDLDGRDPDKAEAPIHWSQQDPFWKKNILSMPKFREKYDQLRLAAIDHWEKNRDTRTPEEDAIRKERPWEYQ